MSDINCIVMESLKRMSISKIPKQSKMKRTQAAAIHRYMKQNRAAEYRRYQMYRKRLYDMKARMRNQYKSIGNRAAMQAMARSR